MKTFYMFELILGECKQDPDPVKNGPDSQTWLPHNFAASEGSFKVPVTYSGVVSKIINKLKAKLQWTLQE